MRAGATALLALATLSVIAAACALLPPQTRPASVAAFSGAWKGTWHSMTRPGATGDVLVQITVAGPDSVSYLYTAPGAPFERRVPDWHARFVNGELHARYPDWENPTRTKVFRLYGAERLEVEWDDRRDGGHHGVWLLQRLRGK